MTSEATSDTSELDSVGTQLRSLVICWDPIATGGVVGAKSRLVGGPV